MRRDLHGTWRKYSGNWHDGWRGDQRGPAAGAGRKFSEAEALYRQVLQSYPTHPETLNLMGVLQYEKGNPTEAIDYLSRALLFRSDYLDARANLGAAYRKWGNWKKRSTTTGWH